MKSGKPVSPHDLKDSIKRLLKETLTETHHRSFFSYSSLKKREYAQTIINGDPVDNSEKLNGIITNNDRELIKHILAEIIVEDKSRRMMECFEDRISDYTALKIYEESLQLLTIKKAERECYLLERLHLISKDKLIENPKNNLELACNILITLKRNKYKIAHSTIRKYVDTVDNDRKQECIKSGILAIEHLIMGEINPKRVIKALQKLNSSKVTNTQLTANSYFSGPGKTHHVLTECYDALLAILNSLRADEFKSYISP